MNRDRVLPDGDMLSPVMLLLPERQPPDDSKPWNFTMHFTAWEAST